MGCSGSSSEQRPNKCEMNMICLERLQVTPTHLYDVMVPNPVPELQLLTDVLRVLKEEALLDSASLSDFSRHVGFCWRNNKTIVQIIVDNKAVTTTWHQAYHASGMSATLEASPNFVALFRHTVQECKAKLGEEVQ